MGREGKERPRFFFTSLTHLVGYLLTYLLFFDTPYDMIISLLVVYYLF